MSTLDLQINSIGDNDDNHSVIMNNRSTTPVMMKAY